MSLEQSLVVSETLSSSYIHVTKRIHKQGVYPSPHPKNQDIGQDYPNHGLGHVPRRHLHLIEGWVVEYHVDEMSFFEESAHYSGQSKEHKPIECDARYVT